MEVLQLSKNIIINGSELITFENNDNALHFTKHFEQILVQYTSTYVPMYYIPMYQKKQ